MKATNSKESVEIMLTHLDDFIEKTKIFITHCHEIDEETRYLLLKSMESAKFETLWSTRYLKNSKGE